MASQSKSDAARANGSKSRGPTTPEGKARSSKNALKHGLTAQLDTLPGESQEELRRPPRIPAADPWLPAFRWEQSQAEGDNDHRMPRPISPWVSRIADSSGDKRFSPSMALATMRFASRAYFFCGPHDFHPPFIYSLCVMMHRMNSTPELFAAVHLRQLDGVVPARARRLRKEP